MKRLTSLLLATVLAITAAPALAKQYRLLSSWDQNYAYNPYILDPFIKGLDEATNGRIKISFSGPETVPPFEQLEPVGAGAFDFLFTHGAYHFGTTPIGTVIDALDGTPDQVRESGVYDWIDQHYQQYGLKLVSLPITPEGAYHIITRQPVTADGDLKGRKIRGSLTYAGIVKMLGGALVVLPASEIYTGLDKGVVDGASWPIIGALEYRWYEVAKNLLRPAFGANYEPIFMNLNAWKRLSPEDKEALDKVGRQVEASWYRDAPAVWAAEEQELIKRGMQVTEMGPDQKARLRTAWSEGLWQLSAEKNAAATKALHELARSKGLAQ